MPLKRSHKLLIQEHCSNFGFHIMCFVVCVKHTLASITKDDYISRSNRNSFVAVFDMRHPPVQRAINAPRYGHITVKVSAVNFKLLFPHLLYQSGQQRRVLNTWFRRSLFFDQFSKFADRCAFGINHPCAYDIVHFFSWVSLTVMVSEHKTNPRNTSFVHGTNTDLDILMVRTCPLLLQCFQHWEGMH